MKLNLACKKFHRLWNDRDSRDLTSSETSFIDRHRANCPDCQAFEESTEDAMGMLRMASLEPDVSPAFEERVIRRLKVQTVRESLGYWSPALVGAGIACVAIFATLQIAAKPVQLEQASLPGGEAKREVSQERPLPRLILREKLRLDQ